MGMRIRHSAQLLLVGLLAAVAWAGNQTLSAASAGRPAQVGAHAATMQELRDRAVRAKRLRRAHVHHVPTAEEKEASNVLSLLLFVMVSSQYALFAWKSRHFQSYQQATLVGLWVFPMGFSLWYHFWKFLGCWAAYSLVTSYFVHLACRKPLPRDAPATIYWWFSTVHHTTHVAALAGYFLGMLDALGLSPFVLLASFFYGPIEMPSPRAMRDEQGHPLPLPRGVGAIFLMRELCALLLFFGLYFGVLTRDVAEVCTQQISTALGLGKKGDDEILSDWARRNTCALCNCDLHPEKALVPAHPALQRRGPVAAAPKQPVKREEPLFELRCGHIFHESCIRGWAIVGKNNTCPFCAAPVDLGLILGNTPWQKQSLVWLQLLDGVRYLIVWHPLILALAHMLVHWLFPHYVFGHHPHPPPAAASGVN